MPVSPYASSYTPVSSTRRVLEDSAKPHRVRTLQPVFLVGINRGSYERTGVSKGVPAKEYSVGSWVPKALPEAALQGASATSFQLWILQILPEAALQGVSVTSFPLGIDLAEEPYDDVLA
ncbi:unnamed protein product [Phytophthora fragariaefolia]|uniref:Unnamed protein product n=1 Tax=Phytophthora fragariaefolia TaxID=1490495 RepID=A0A9W7CN83_9STRA|nr:unnamed protein product [Phytophthora fragariaefolia]